MRPTNHIFPIAFVIMDQRIRIVGRCSLLRCGTRYQHGNRRRYYIRQAKRINGSRVSCLTKRPSQLLPSSLGPNLYRETRDNMTRKYIWATARQFIEVGFQRTMTTFQSECPQSTVRWVSAIAPKYWSWVYFPESDTNSRRATWLKV